MNEHEDYLFLGAGTPDPEIVALEHLLSPLAHDGCELPLERLGPDASHRATLRPWLWLAAAMLVSLAMALALSRATKLQRGSSSRTFVAQQESLTLPLEPFGQVVLQGGAELEFVHWRDDELRVRLRRGTCVVEIDETARQGAAFVVVETELGEVAVEEQARRCFGELSMDPGTHTGELRVHDGLGRVGSEARTVVVPAGAAVRLSLAGPSLPLFGDATDELRKMVTRAAAYAAKGVDLDTKLAVDLVATCRMPRDTLVLWHLLQTDDEVQRASAEAALVALAGRPEPIVKGPLPSWSAEVWLAFLQKGAWRYAK